jgi:ATP-dependent RNA helicase UAP56/SUB2
MKDFKRFSKYMNDLVCTVVFGGINLKQQKDELKSNPPHIVVGTPGRVKQVCC